MNVVARTLGDVAVEGVDDDSDFGGHGKSVDVRGYERVSGHWAGGGATDEGAFIAGVLRRILPNMDRLPDADGSSR